MTAPRPLVIGAGAAGSGDDAAGRQVARLLAGGNPPFDVAEARGTASELVALFESRGRVVIADACRSGAAPGTIHRFDVAQGPLPAMLNAVSSHGMGVGEAIELARALNLLPPRCVVYAIEGAQFETGAPVSAPVAAAIARCADEITRELATG